MKRFRFLSVLLMVFSAISFVACDTEPVDPVLTENIGENQPGDAVFKVNFSDETHTAIQATAKFEEGMLSIAGVMGTNAEFVSITLDDYAVKTYNEAFIGYYPGSSTAGGYLNINPETGQNNGQVVITEVDTVNNTISGTFSFTGYYVDVEMNLPSIAFTNGVFENIPITGLPQNPGTNPVNQKLFKAKVNGTAKTFGTIMPISSAGTLSLTGTNVASQESISISVPESITAGTYDLEDFTDYYAAYLGGDSSFSSESGTLTITSNTGGWIKGTFEFSGHDFDDNPMTITEGEFSVQY
ncbi:DUF6252 family protein [Flavobacterium sp. NRK1]|uniref:DUF6252 family protein n=1 Tax=Flavobacterium sp. NRK1 TaxID=2954929 RepID=UPI002093D4F9|nr:DUF6252 family protein [Flavobacterium sp. NRK1]MCO6146538.1 DUF6252 family protein [Flavobacterium sp. NRK1]